MSSPAWARGRPCSVRGWRPCVGTGQCHRMQPVPLSAAGVPFTRRARWAVAGVVLGVLTATGCATPESGGLFGGKTADRQVTGWVSLDASLRDLTGDVTWAWPVTTTTCDVALEVPANTTPSARNGTWVSVDEVTVNGDEIDVVLDAAGTRLTGKLDGCVEPGDRFEVGVRFRGYAGTGGNERIGFHRSTSWWGSVIPRPAWSTPDGWFEPLAVRDKGEALTSPVFEVVNLDVSLPASATLVAQGEPQRGPVTGDRVTYRVADPGVRDVAFAAGYLSTARVGAPGCEVEAAVPAGPGSTQRARRVAAEGLHGLRALKKLFRFCPYPLTKVVAVQPGYGGMEFPGLVVVAEHDPARQPRLIAHEMAHQFFYAFLGSDQGRHPWLDEAFATWGESLINPATGRDLDNRTWPADADGRVGRPMSYWNDHPQWYSTAVYARGASAIREARTVAGPARFDEALRNWAAECGQQICGPGRLRAALEATAPAAVKVLGQAGAWD